LPGASTFSASTSDPGQLDFVLKLVTSVLVWGIKMAKIFVSDAGDDKNDGQSDATPIRSWARVLELKTGNDKLHIIGASSNRSIIGSDETPAHCRG
jgi:hypothetical protein